MPKKLFVAALVVLAFVTSRASSAEDELQREMRSLDGQVQEIKSDVLDIAAELNLLEEQLLYPSNTQVSVFVSLDSGEAFRLDAVQLHIDGELATHHIYSFKELEALQSGGVQRLYMTNVKSGPHDLAVSVIGKLTNGEEFKVANNFTFDKGVEPSLLGLTVAPPDAGPTSIRLQDW